MKYLFFTLLILSVSSRLAYPLHNEARVWQGYEAVLEQIKTPVFKSKQFNIKDFGAKEFGDCTRSINQAIQSCHKQGGGTVVIPAGEFHTAPVVLLSNVCLHISEGATLKFSTNPHDYLPSVISRWEGMDCYNLSPLIYAYGQENVAVTGNGVLDGQANKGNWWKMKARQSYVIENGVKRDGGKTRLVALMEDSVSVSQRVFEVKDELRPPFIQFYRCKNILIEGITIRNAPFWLIHPVFSENITVRKVTMDSHGPNNDGCDPESCRNVLIEDCFFNTGDDCVAIKSGRNKDGRRWNTPSENIIVRNCIMKDGHAGVAIGSEISGGFRNLWVENCVMDSPNLDRCIRIKSNAIRGGQIANIYVRNIRIGECEQAVFKVEMKYENVLEGHCIPSVRNVYMENVNSKKSQYALFVDDLEAGCVEDVYLKNCSFEGVSNPQLNFLPKTLQITFDQVKINGINYEKQ